MVEFGTLDKYNMYVNVKTKDGVIRVLSIVNLAHKIDPPNCTIKVSEKRITIALAKWLRFKWEEGLTRPKSTQY